MTREIKFRAWDKQDEVMRDGDHTSDGRALALNELIQSLEQRDFVLMQYTGLKDKNGKEIYQGDILKIARDKENYGETSYGGFAEVTAETCGYSMRCFNPTFKELEPGIIDDEGDFQTWDSTSLWHLHDDDGKNIETIGNIYENPDLTN